MRYLLDTNILSEPVKPTPNALVVERMKENRDQIGTAALVWHELLYGCRRLPPSKQRRRFEHYLNEVLEPSLSILPYDAKAADWHAAQRARLVGEGRTPAFIDGQIAAVAVTNDLVLVTRNVRDFVVFEGVRIEDWGDRPDARPAL